LDVSLGQNRFENKFGTPLMESRRKNAKNQGFFTLLVCRAAP